MRVFKRDHTQKANVKEANCSPKLFIKPLNFMFIDIQTQFRKFSFKILVLVFVVQTVYAYTDFRRIIIECNVSFF